MSSECEEETLKRFNDKLGQAEKHYRKYENTCREIYHLLEPMIHNLNVLCDETCVFNQPGDGFILMYDRKGVIVPFSAPVLSVVKTFLEKGEKLNEDDLFKISI